MLHRASSAGNLFNGGAAGAGYNNQQRRSSSPLINVASAGNLMPTARKPDFAEGSILEEKDKCGRVVTRWRVGGFLGQGGFAKVYQCCDMESSGSAMYALKVCSRQKLIETKTLGKLQVEISTHRKLSSPGHKNIVKFVKSFEDAYNVYLVLELCSGKTLMDISKQRKRFTVPETQFFMLQIISAVNFMHSHNIIHRDLKLGNTFLDDDMNVKIGDLGLAAELLYDEERKRTICGTPNYIAPEILQNGRDGHSFEVDVWSVGVILYTLLVGEPPFQTSDVKATYSRIKSCKYSYPPGIDVPESARNLIQRILQINPAQRPTLMEIRDDAFFKNPVPPTMSPLSLFPSQIRQQKEMQRATAAATYGAAGAAPAAACARPAVGCGMEKPMVQQQPPAQAQPGSGREPLRPLYNGAAAAAPWPPQSKAVAVNNNNVQAMPLSARNANAPAPVAAPPMPSSRPGSARAGPFDNVVLPPAPAGAQRVDDDERDNEELHRTLCEMPSAPVASAGTAASSVPATATTLHPGCQHPTMWVTHYSDFSSRYGLAYKLSTGHTGVHFNDNTKMVWEPTTSRVEYYTRTRDTVANGQQIVSDKRDAFLMEEANEDDANIKKKTTLIKYFRSYIRAGGREGSASVVRCSAVPEAQLPSPSLSDQHMSSDMIYVKRWVQTSQAMVFRLSNRVIQVCFADRSQVILSSESRVVTFVATDANGGARRTMPLSAVTSEGGELADKLTFTKDILSRLIANRDI